jgi:hypothetical protein
LIEVCFKIRKAASPKAVFYILKAFALTKTDQKREFFLVSPELKRRSNNCIIISEFVVINNNHLIQKRLCNKRPWPGSIMKLGLGLN